MTKKAQNERPEYLSTLSNQKSGTEHLGPEDTVWLGSDFRIDPETGLGTGGIDASALIAEHGHDPDPVLHWILLAIIDAHPQKNHEKTRLDRLWKALSALTGETRTKAIDDYSLLLEIAWQYHVACFEEGKFPKLRPIVSRVVSKLPEGFLKERNIQKQSLIEMLEDKFREQKELLLVRATSDNNWNRMDTARAVRGVLKELNKLGIKADSNAIAPRRVKKDVSIPT